MFTTILTTLALAAAATARIVGIAVPSTIAAGSNFTITIITENYIQSVLDVSAAFGFYPQVFSDTLGSYIDSIYLGPAQSNIISNVSVSANLPPSTPSGSGYLNAAITSLYGASLSPTTIIWNLPITVSNSTSSSLVSSFDGQNICSSSTSSATATATQTATGTASVTSATTTSTLQPGQLNDVIQSVQGGLQSLLQFIVVDNLTSAQANYNNLSPFFDLIQRLAAPSGTCPTVTGKQLTKNEALGLIQTIQGLLNEISLDVTNGDSAEALNDVCAARADYFNSGLREYIF